MSGAALETAPLFAALGTRRRRRLARRATGRRYGAGSVVVREGDTSMTLYVVLSGRVRVVREGEPIAELGPGCHFGELGLLGDTPRSATVVALEPTECALVDKWDFERQLRRERGVALALLAAAGDRLRAR